MAHPTTPDTPLARFLRPGLEQLRQRVHEPGGGRLCRVTTTDGLLALAADARDRDSNRQANVRELALALDPDGVHVLAMQLPHNDVEWRTLWLVKHHGDAATPVELWLDVSFTALAMCTTQVEVQATGTDLGPVGEA